MATRQADDPSQEHLSDPVTASARRVEPHVSNANRVVVGFPFSTIKIDDAASAAAVADVVARMCRMLAASAPTDAFAGLATEAEDLTARLRR